MKVASDELFLLIKSLSTQEKVYFKAFGIKRRRKKNSLGYLIMFDELEKMKEFDDARLRLNLKKRGFNQNIKESKRRVIETVLNSLSDFHSGMNKDIELQQLIHQVNILLEKKLLKMAFKILSKAKRIAEDYERFEYLLILSRLEEDMLKERADIAALEKYFDEEDKKRKQYINNLKNIVEFKQLSHQILTKFRANADKNNREHEKKIERIQKHPLLKDPDNAITYISREYFYYIKFACSKLLNKVSDKDYEEQKDWIAYLEKDRSKLIFRKTNYLVAIGNLMITMYFLKKTKDLDIFFQKALTFIKSLPPIERTKQSLSSFAFAFNNYISFQLLMLNPVKALGTWKELKGTDIYDAMNSYQGIIIFGNLTNAHFLLHQYKKALSFVNKIINIKNENRVDIQQYARLMSLIINYELSKTDLLPYLAKSIERYLIKNNGSIPEFDKCILTYFERKLSKISNKREEKEVFSKWRNELIQLPHRSLFLGEAKNATFDFIAWLESKIEGRPFIDILKERKKKQESNVR